MLPFRTLDTVAAPIAVANIDTDQIIPARFLSRPRDAGYAGQLFHDLRFRFDGVPDTEFVLNDLSFAGAGILVVDRNFGCGSSRETAVWALMDYGVRCVIAPSFGDIFFNNSFRNGLLPVVLAQAEVEALLVALQHKQDLRVVVDLENQTVVGPGGMAAHFEVPPFEKTMLLTGLDEIGLTLAEMQRLVAFEHGYDRRKPWV